MRKIINRLAYFFNDYDNYAGITIITLIGEFVIGTIYALMDFSKTGSRDQFNDNMFILVLVALLTGATIMIFRRIFDVIILSDFKKLTTKTKHKALDYKEKTLSKGDEEEKYYVINIDEENVKIVKADTVLINKQDKFADSEHKAGTTDIKYIEIKLDDSLPAYKREIFNQKTKYKNRLNVINYVSTEV